MKRISLVVLSLMCVLFFSIGYCFATVEGVPVDEPLPIEDK